MGVGVDAYKLEDKHFDVGECSSAGSLERELTVFFLLIFCHLFGIILHETELLQ